MDETFRLLYCTSTCEAWCLPIYAVYVTFFGFCVAPVGPEGRRRSREEEEEEALKRKQLQEEHLSKVSQNN